MKERIKERLKPLWTWLKNKCDFIFDKELSIRSAALSYYSLMGIIPLLAGFMLLGGFTQTDISFSPIVRFILPSMDSTISCFGDFSAFRISDLFSRYKGLGIIATFIILFSIRCFLINIQQSFNYIWESEERDWKRREEFNILLFIVGVIVVLISTIIFKQLPNTIWKSLFVAVASISVITASFCLIPYDKHPKFKSALLSSLIVVLLLCIWILLLPLISGSLNQFEFEGIQFLLLVFFMYWAWYICILGAKICRTIDKSDYLNMRVKIEKLAPIYELYLSIFTMANIVRKFGSQYNIENGLCFKDIRKDMFKFENETGEQNKDVQLPMPLLDRIIDKLRHLGFIDISKGDRGVRYVVACKRENSFDMSVGDFLFQYFFYNNFDLKTPYQKLQAELNDKLSTLFLQMSCELKDIKLRDLLADTNIVCGISTVSDSFEDYKKRYKRFKSGNWEDAYDKQKYELMRQSMKDIYEMPDQLDLINQILSEQKKDSLV